MKRYEGSDIVIEAYRRGGYYILRISTYDAHYVATRNSSRAHIESWWSFPYEKKFERADVANNYFKAVKRWHPDLRKVLDDPSMYMTHDGKEAHY